MQAGAKVAPENLLHHLGLAGAQQSVVDENAGELVAYGLVNERRRDARIDAAAEAEDDAFIADLGAYFLDGLLDVIAHGPIPAAAAHAVDKVTVNLAAARGVDDFGMELQAVAMEGAVFNGRVIRIVGGGHGDKPARQARELVAVRIPNLQRIRQPLKQRA